MAALPIEVLYGIYPGLLTGIIPALVAGGLGFAFRYVTGVTLPGLGVVALAVAIAGVNGGLLGLLEEDVASSPRSSGRPTRRWRPSGSLREVQWPESRSERST
ncbi:MAG: hypothetical protein ACI9YT_002675 [Halobacteriales archaeon]|jgi:hypothetical protein